MAGHASAYKNIPLLPDHAHMALAGRRTPDNGNWYATPRIDPESLGRFLLPYATTASLESWLLS